MKRLFAGWRMKYVSQAKEPRKSKACLFCHLRRTGDDTARWILSRRKDAFLVLNAYPYNTGHLMVSIHRHVGRVGDLTAAERRALWDLAALGESLLEEVYHPEGFNVGLNLGRCAGAGFDGHLHLHIVPRWAGDANFMTTVGEDKVMPESLSDTYHRLQAALRGRSGRRAGKRSASSKRR